MKAVVDKKMCNGCTICNITCPEVFRIQDDGKAESYVAVIPKNVEQICVEAADECPANAIMLEYDHFTYKAFTKQELQLQECR